MRAITTLPGVADSARLEEIPEPPDAPDTLLVDAIAIGVCGTDIKKIAALTNAHDCGLRRAASIKKGATPMETTSPTAAETVFATSSPRV